MGIFSRDPNERWKTLCLPCWKEKFGKQSTKATQTPPPPPPKVIIREVPAPIPSDMLSRLIRLAHPDRHDNSEAANIATAWLLSQRNR